MEYDVVSGVSAGSFNTLGLAAFEKGKEEACYDWLTNLWTSLKETDVIEEYPEGIVKAISEESSVFTTDNLFKFLRAKYDKVAPVKDRNIFWNCADANSGTYIQLTETTDDPVKATISSGSIPFVFPPQWWPE